MKEAIVWIGMIGIQAMMCLYSYQIGYLQGVTESASVSAKQVNEETERDQPTDMIQQFRMVPNENYNSFIRP